MNNLRAAKLRSAIFAKNILHHGVGETILQILSRCADAEYRTWLNSVTGIYPVQTHLRRIGGQLVTAYFRKETSYAPLTDALYYYETEVVGNQAPPW